MTTASKPEKPKKKIVERQRVTIDFTFVSNKISIDNLLAYIPADAQNVTLELIEDLYYDGCVDDCATSLELSWDAVVTNPSYEKEMKKFKKNLEKWKKGNL